METMIGCQVIGTQGGIRTHNISVLSGATLTSWPTWAYSTSASLSRIALISLRCVCVRCLLFST